MVVALGPGKFYGSSLPRPRFYTDVKFNDERVDPPPPVMDPLMAWAQDAHWSMGGLSFTRHRLQGRIEGKVEKLRAQREQMFKRSQKQQKASKGSTASRPDKDKSSSRVTETQKQQKASKGSTASRTDKDKSSSRVTETPSPPPAPVAIKRRRVVGLADEEEEEVATKRGAVRKLGDDFERVARESGMAANGGGAVAARTRSKRNDANLGSDEGKINRGKKKLVKGGRKIGTTVVAAAAGVRTSPRLARNSDSN